MSDELCINTIRVLSADIVQKANSGHPGAPMGLAPLAHLVWTNFLKFNPGNPKWIARDRFVLSNGHACVLQYVMLHLSGYEEFTMEELKRFRQLGSKTPGHPESSLVRGGIEVSTGPLGQGISNAVGLAIAEAHLAATYNRPGFPIFSNYTIVFCGDGCLEEGISSEAGSLAGHLGLGKLIVFYDDNHVTIDGDTILAFTENVLQRYEAYGWHVQFVANGDSDLESIRNAFEAAKRVTDKPSLIKIRTTIGIGSSKQGTEKVHGSPLGAEDVARVKKYFGFNPEQFFYVPEEVRAVYNPLGEKGKDLENEWNMMFERYRATFPELAMEIERRFRDELPVGWREWLPTYHVGDPDKATRQLSQIVINRLGPKLPELIGGSADLNPSTLSYLECSKDFQQNSCEGRNIRFGVREHAMAAICNGLAAYGGMIPYAATFLNFIGYAMGAVRLSAISEFGVIYVMTHDSIGLGEDGPTHQPVESLMMLRATPHLLVLRPADGNEVSGAYAVALENRRRPCVIALSRQAVPHLPGTSIEGVFRGAYVIGNEKPGPSDPLPQVILVGTGSETHLCRNAAAQLTDLQVRVVSMPSWELFREQPADYQRSVFPKGVPVLAVEAGSAIGWREYAHAVIAMHSFGASAPFKDVFEKFGFTVDNVVRRVREMLAYYRTNQPESLVSRPF